MASAVGQTNLLVDAKANEVFHTVKASQFLAQIMVKAYKRWKRHVRAMAVYLKPCDKLVIALHPDDFWSAANKSSVYCKALPFVIEWVPKVIHPKN